MADWYIIKLLVALPCNSIHYQSAQLFIVHEAMIRHNLENYLLVFGRSVVKLESI